MSKSQQYRNLHLMNRGDLFSENLVKTICSQNITINDLFQIINSLFHIDTR